MYTYGVTFNKFREIFQHLAFIFKYFDHFIMIFNIFTRNFKTSRLCHGPSVEKLLTTI